MNADTIFPGDILYASHNIINDGSMPGFAENEIIAEAGQRGVLINTGHLEDNPEKILLLIQFEKPETKGEFGPPVAVWPDEIYIDDDVNIIN